MMRFLLATSNPHKLDEIKAVITDPALEIVTLKDIGLDIDEPVEDQPTFEGNALLKAQYYADAAGLPCFADDSGLEVDALDGAPGVYSARYSGMTGGRDVVDPANNQKLLNELGDLPTEKRSARFVCAMALCFPPGSQTFSKTGSDPVLNTVLNKKGIRNLFRDPIVVRGTIEGRILGPGDEGYAIDNPRGIGKNGFGYDPLFFVPELGKTTAQLTPDHKNSISHRGKASRLIWDQLKNLI
ncbi:MAG: non-canonical purine NTP pyrophosphatase [Phycisphaeraceae bacterium]|nr:non-canonical purine NTP pyrophosphatase [Phycisphaeraceae bacterium]